MFFCHGQNYCCGRCNLCSIYFINIYKIDQFNCLVYSHPSLIACSHGCHIVSNRDASNRISSVIPEFGNYTKQLFRCFIKNRYWTSGGANDFKNYWNGSISLIADNGVSIWIVVYSSKFVPIVSSIIPLVFDWVRSNESEREICSTSRIYSRDVWRSRQSHLYSFRSSLVHN